MLDTLASLTDLAARLSQAARATHDVGDRLRLLRDLVPGRLCLTNGFGIEGQLLTAHAAELDGAIEIMTLDTGRLFPESRDLWQRTEQRLGVSIATFAPTPEAVAALVERDGPDGFYDSVAKRRACCDTRKLEPLSRALDGAAAWITGLRMEQSPGRKGVSFAAVDAARGLLKINPLYDWTRAEVLAELAARDIPVSALEARGYRSVGCEPCTRAVRPNEPERAGRWWWEGAGSAKECGLHAPSHASLTDITFRNSASVASRSPAVPA